MGDCMNISKKLLMIAIFGLSMQPIAQAYGITELKTKVVHILDFIDTCKQNGPEALKIAQWLEDKINTTSDSSYDTQDIEIITIARTITANTTMDTKIDLLKKQMAEDLAAKAQRDAYKSRSKKIFAALTTVIACSYATLLITPMIELYNKTLTKRILTKTKWSEIFKKKLFA